MARDRDDSRAARDQGGLRLYGSDTYWGRLGDAPAPTPQPIAAAALPEDTGVLYARVARAYVLGLPEIKVTANLEHNWADEVRRQLRVGTAGNR